MENYSLLCSLLINHAYFSDALCDDLSLVPDAATRQLMDDLHIVFRQTDEGWNLYYDTEYYQPAMLSSFAGQKLSFVLNSSDTCFLNYTLLPSFTNANALYFTNANKSKSKTTTSSLSLTAARYAGSKEIVTLYPSTLTCAVSGNQNKVGLTDLFKNKINPSFTDTTSVVFNQLNGAYLLTNDRGSTPVYASDSAYQSKPLAIVEFYLYMQDNAYTLFDEGTIAPKNFVISFDSRSAKWRYYVINKTNLKVDNLSIASIDNKIMFVDDGSVIMQNLPASVLISKAVIKMQQYPDRQFNLSLKSNNKSSTFNNIVLPSAESLRTENKTNFIDAYIYI
jgi:hypothetical protein